MSNYWSDIVKKIEPYVPGEQPKDKKYIKLNTNENPYPPSPLAIEAIKKAETDDLRLYPDPLCTVLVNEIADFYEVTKRQVFVGNGSDEVLAFAFLAFFNQGDRILYPDITYSFYPVYSNMFQVNYDLVPLDSGFDIAVEDYLRANDGIIIANPNAPTGKILSLDAISTILEANAGQVVIIDEAYIDFGGATAVDLVKSYPNLLVVQTMSKSRSLAGLRIGYAIGHEDLIDGLNRVKNSINSYTLDRLALVAGAAAMKDRDYFEVTCQKVIKTRVWLVKRLEALGFDVPTSKANFVFAAPSLMDAKALFIKLKEQGILVRYFNQSRIDGYLRISIGTDQEMEALCVAVERIQEAVVRGGQQ